MLLASVFCCFVRVSRSGLWCYNCICLRILLVWGGFLQILWLYSLLLCVWRLFDCRFTLICVLLGYIDLLRIYLFTLDSVFVLVLFGLVCGLLVGFIIVFICWVILDCELVL